MKRIIVFTLALGLVSSITSCKKWDGKTDKKEDYYYSDDYREADGTILDQEISEITTLYSVFFYEGSMLKYKLVAEKNDESQGCFGKCKGDLEYEEGQAQVDDDLNITFIPDSDPNGRYYGYFENEKKNYKVTIPTADSREINFKLK